MKNLVTIGKVLKPRGLSGEVKVQIFTNITKAFSLVENVEKVSFSGGFAFMKFKDVKTIETANTIRGKLIQVPRELLPLGDDEVLADDLIGFEVVDENGKRLGAVRNIESVGMSEVFDCGHFMLPNEDAFIIETNMRTKQIIIKAEMLESETIL